jgi:hypothetical protein
MKNIKIRYLPFILIFSLLWACGGSGGGGGGSVVPEPPNFVWELLFGGSGVDSANSISLALDDGYIVAGYSSSNDILGLLNNGSEDAYVIKLLPDGTVDWQKMFGGSGLDFATSIQQTIDDGYIAAGYSASTDILGLTMHGVLDFYVVKLDQDGNVDWQEMYGGLGIDSAVAVQPTADGGYIVAGYSTSISVGGALNHGLYDIYLVKLDESGNVDWQKMYGGLGIDYATSIQQTADGGYIVAGYSTSIDILGVTNHGLTDSYIIKLDGSGNVEWQKMYGGLSLDYATAIQPTADGGYIVAGYSSSIDITDITNHGLVDAYFIKLDADGNVEWQEMYGGSGNDYMQAIQQTLDGGYIAAGYSASVDILDIVNKGLSDVYVIKLGEDGSIDWQKMFGGNGDDQAYGVQQAADLGYAIAGYSSSTDLIDLINQGQKDYYILKLNEDGNME